MYIAHNNSRYVHCMHICVFLICKIEQKVLSYVKTDLDSAEIFMYSIAGK